VTRPEATSPEDASPEDASPETTSSRDAIALLDVNVLVALFDPEHVHHEAAHGWFGVRQSVGWATCPLTENGLLRVISSSAYPGRRTTLVDAVDRLARFRASGHHSFWPDSISLCDAPYLDLTQVRGPAQLTDAYLLALAVAKEGTLATFDRRIALASVPEARPGHLELIAG
jgi:toxin-antitoxin system PIN domain toxin